MAGKIPLTRGTRGYEGYEGVRGGTRGYEGYYEGYGYEGYEGYDVMRVRGYEAGTRIAGYEDSGVRGYEVRGDTRGTRGMRGTRGTWANPPGVCTGAPERAAPERNARTPRLKVLWTSVVWFHQKEKNSELRTRSETIGMNPMFQIMIGHMTDKTCAIKQTRRKLYCTAPILG